MKLTKDQKDHAAFIADQAKAIILSKYIKGAIEHDGNLWEKTPLELLNEAINEAADELVYLLTLRDKLRM